MVEIKYGDRVKVTKGFYEGCQGMAMNYSDSTKKYEIEIVSLFMGVVVREKTIIINKKEVEKIK